MCAVHEASPFFCEVVFVCESVSVCVYVCACMLVFVCVHKCACACECVRFMFVAAFVLMTWVFEGVGFCIVSCVFSADLSLICAGQCTGS